MMAHLSSSLSLPESRVRNFGCNYLASSVRAFGYGSGLVALPAGDGCLGLYAVVQGGQSVERIECTLCTSGTVRDVGWSPQSVSRGELLAVVTEKDLLIFHVTVSSTPVGLLVVTKNQILHNIPLPKSAVVSPNTPLAVTRMQWFPSALPSLLLFCSNNVAVRVELPRGSKEAVFSPVASHSKGTAALCSDGALWVPQAALNSSHKNTALTGESKDGDVAACSCSCHESGCVAAVVLPTPNAPTNSTQETPLGAGRPFLVEIIGDTAAPSAEDGEMEEVSSSSHRDFSVGDGSERSGQFPHVLSGAGIFDALRVPWGAPGGPEPPRALLLSPVTPFIALPPSTALFSSRAGSVFDCFVLLRASDGTERRLTGALAAGPAASGKPDMAALHVSLDLGSKGCGGGAFIAWASCATAAVTVFSPSLLDGSLGPSLRVALDDTRALRCRGLTWLAQEPGKAPLLLVLAAERAKAAPLASAASASSAPLRLLVFRLDTKGSASISPASTREDSSSVPRGGSPDKTEQILAAFEARLLAQLQRLESSMQTSSSNIVVKVDALANRVSVVESVVARIQASLRMS